MRFIARRLFAIVPVLIAVSFLTFSLMNLLPGGPEINILGPLAIDMKKCTPEAEKKPQVKNQCDTTRKVRRDLGSDKPFFSRYARWVNNALHGNFGDSVSFNLPVWKMIKQRLPTSLWLMLYAQLIALVIAIPLAILSAYRADGIFDRVVTSVSFAAIALPNFVLAMLLIFLRAKLKDSLSPTTFPTLYTGSGNLLTRFNQLTLPALTLGLGLAATYLRLLRTDMIATLQNDFVLMAKAKGMSARYILTRHALRPSTFSLITVAGIQVGVLIGGALVVEGLFSVPGLGRLTTEGVFRRDYMMVQACVVVVAAAYVVINILVDILYGFLDPRVRHARAVG